MDLVGVYTEVMIRWLDAIEAGNPPKIFGDGSQSMDFVHVVDVARANIAAAQSSATNEVFNVGTGIRTSLKQLCETMLEVMGSSLKPVHEAPRQVGNVLARQAAVEKAEKMLGFRAKLTLAQGLRDLIEWRKAVKAGLVETVQA
jgi:UDP-glucose 4-epimerase